MKRSNIIGITAAFAALVMGAVGGTESTYASSAFRVDFIARMADMKADIKSTLNIDVELEEGTGSTLSYKPKDFLAYVPLTSNDIILKADIVGGEMHDALRGYYNNWLATNDFDVYNSEYIKTFDTDTADKAIIICDNPGGSNTDVFKCNIVNIIDGVESGYNVENKAMVNKLAMAYEAAGNDNASDLVILAEDTLEDKIVESEEYDGYATLRTNISFHNGIGSEASLWYRTSKDGEWKYFAAGHGTPLCSKYNTEDLQKAFSGTVCYDEKEGKDSTVAFIEKKEDEKEDAPGTPDTGYNSEDTSSMAIRTIFIAAPAALIVGYIAKYTCDRMSKKVKFTKR